MVSPRNVLPSPLPDESQAGLAKNWTRKALFAVLLSDPRTAVPLPLNAWVRTGKFCRRLAPVSVSQASLAETPLAPRSMPSAPFEKMALPRMRLLVAPVRTRTPA